MKKFLLVLAMVFVVNHTYLVDDLYYMDFELNGQKYEGVYIEDAVDLIDLAVNHEIDSKEVVAGDRERI